VGLCKRVLFELVAEFLEFKGYFNVVSEVNYEKHQT
jgi:hypothetical protein